ncbi:MAG: PmbA/TldA family metallopeptidase, partial [Casimicrobium sp.]
MSLSAVATPAHSSFDAAQSLLLAPSGVSLDQLASTLGNVRSRGIEFADIYFEHNKSESWSLEEGIVTSGSFSIEQGVGVRAINGEQTAFAYSGDLSLASINRAANTVGSIGASGKSATVALRPIVSPAALYRADDPLASISDEAKITLLKKIEAVARARDPRVTQVMVSLACEHVVMLV